MKTKTQDKKIARAAQTQNSLFRDFFVAKPERTLEWLGGVNYENLEKTLSGVKELLAEDPAEEIHLNANS